MFFQHKYNSCASYKDRIYHENYYVGHEYYTGHKNFTSHENCAGHKG